MKQTIFFYIILFYKVYYTLCFNTFANPPKINFSDNKVSYKRSDRYVYMTLKDRI
jgi:hypothetical protein